MAKQHFYSRVPARMSMYRHVDGEDTFAQSEGLDEEYIESTVGKLLTIKLTAEEKASVERGSYPPVYCVYNGPEGDRLQSKLIWLPKDFSGEQSCKLVHTFVMSGAEAKEALSEPDSGVLNPAMFSLPAAELNPADAASRFDDRYPEVPYVARTVADEEIYDWYQKYPYNTVRQFLYVLLDHGFSNNGAPVYVMLPEEEEQISEAAVNFMNVVLSPFPDFIRNLATFCTYTADLNRFRQCRVRFVSHSIEGSASTAKGSFFEFSNRPMANIIKDDHYRSNALTVEFIYSLYENHDMRRKFISFYENAVAGRPEYEKYDRSFGEFIHLFKQCSGFFKEEEAFPDDAAVGQLLTSYEKYRDLLQISDRCRIVAIVQRYAGQKIAIPKEIFARIGRLYPKEPAECKEVIMDAVLDLIHTDVMRNKLFALIKSNFDAELPERKTLILQHLAQVFRGGFLQPQIMALVNDAYDSEPTESQTYILERLLLTLRTDAVQDEILTFLRGHAAQATGAQYESVLSSLLDMLLLDDRLCGKCIRLLDGILSDLQACATEDAANRAELLAGGVMNALESGKQAHLFGIIVAEHGLLYHATLRHALLAWGGRKPTGLFFLAVFEGSAEQMKDALNEVETICKETAVPDKAISAMGEAWKTQAPAAFRRINLLGLCRFETAIRPLAEHSVHPGMSRWIQRIKSEALLPEIANQVYRALEPSMAEGLQEIVACLNAQPELENHPAVTNLRRAERFLAALQEKNLADALAIFVQLPADEDLKQALSAKLKGMLAAGETEWYADERYLPIAVFYETVCGYPDAGTFLLEDVCRTAWEKRLKAQQMSGTEIERATGKPTEQSSKAAYGVTDAIARFCVLLEATDCAEGLRMEVYAGVESRLQKACAAMTGCMRGIEKKQLPELISQIRAAENSAGTADTAGNGSGFAVSAALQQAFSPDKGGKGFFARLFGKRK